MIWEHKKGIQAIFLTRDMEHAAGVARTLVNLSTKTAEQRAMETNRRILCNAFDRPDIELAMGKQVHGTHVEYASRTEIHEDTDGLVTDRTGLALAVLVADCAALILTDRVNKVAAVAHAGWRGAAGGITDKVVHKMITLGAEPDLIECYISPCISQKLFEVGEEVASQFPDRFVDRSGQKPHVDLQRFLEYELIKNGVPVDQIVSDVRCTYLSPEKLHSYRRDGESAGRMMAAVLLT